MKRIPSAIRIRKAAPFVLSRLGRIASFFKKEDDDLVFYSALGDGNSVSDHLVWIHGMIKHDAKILRKLREEGVDLFVDIRGDSRELTLEPNAIELPHKLGIPTEITLKK